MFSLMLKSIRLGSSVIENNLWMSPLCGVTDIPFRALVKEQGAGLVHTQMVSCAALVRGGDSNRRTREIMALAAGAAALVVHGRTRSQGYGGRADWRTIAAVKKAVSIPVIGNGDLFTPQDIALQLAESGVDGVMLGRGAMGNPWLFSRALAVLRGEADPGAPSAQTRVATLRRHIGLSHSRRGQPALAEMRKHAMWYLKGLPEAAERRRELNATLDFYEITAILDAYLGWLDAHPEMLAADREGAFTGAGVAGLEEAV